METEIVLFLRKEVPDAPLRQNLSALFGSAGDETLVVRYAQGFAIGVSMPAGDSAAVHHAAAGLCQRLGTDVLLEAGSGDMPWLLFSPGLPAPLGVDVIELRHGLDVAMPAAWHSAMPAASRLHA